MNVYAHENHLYEQVKRQGDVRYLKCHDAECSLGVSCSLPAGSAADSSAGISFTHGPILGFFAPQGRHSARIKVKFGREELK